MKVLVLAPEPFFEERGTPIAVHLLLQALSARGEEIDLLTYPVGADRQYPGVTLHRIPRIPGINQVPPGLSLRKLACDFFMAFHAWGLVRRKRYDLIHAVEESGFMAMALRRLCRIPFVYDMDSSMSQQIVEKHRWLGPMGSFMEWCEGKVIRSAMAVIPVCTLLEETARRHAARKTFLLRDISLLQKAEPSAAERALFPPPEAGCRFLYMGNLESYQGIDLLLAAFRKMGAAGNAPPAQLVVAGGKAADVQRYRAESAALGIAERVHFLGPQPMARLAALLELADVVVSPRTRGINTPMKVYSYMASGKPILATDLPTHTQVLTPETAQLAAPEPEAFAEGMRRLAGDAALRQRLGTSARAAAERDHSLESYRRGVDRIYDWLASQVRPAAV